MYQPNFCAECSVKIIRLRWRLWTSRRFCERCSPRFAMAQVRRVASLGVLLFLVGLLVGQAAHRTPPAVVIQRTQNPIAAGGGGQANRPTGSDESLRRQTSTNNASSIVAVEIYACGARTKKGTPCTR